MIRFVTLDIFITQLIQWNLRITWKWIGTEADGKAKNARPPVYHQADDEILAAIETFLFNKISRKGIKRKPHVPWKYQRETQLSLNPGHSSSVFFCVLLSAIWLCRIIVPLLLFFVFHSYYLNQSPLTKLIESQEERRSQKRKEKQNFLNMP